LGVEKRYLHEFDVSAPFFDSLRVGYDGFNEWYQRSCQSQRECWCITDEQDELLALCIFKAENSPEVTDDRKSLSGRVLKLCTLKVGEDIRGRKIGERLLYTAFTYAVEENFDWVYMHSNSSVHEHLIDLCTDYGFKLYGSYAGDDVYSKPMRIHLLEEPESNLDYAIQYYPNYRMNASVPCFIIPMQTAFHEDLFPDISDFSNSLFANDPNFYNPQSNTIKKAYICHANISSIPSGALLLFYRTQDRKSIEVVGIAERSIRTSDINVAMTMIAKRTVFSYDQISEKLQKPALIILFRLVKYIPAINRSDMQSAGIEARFKVFADLTLRI